MAEDASPQTDTHKSIQEQLNEERTLRHFTERVLDCRQKELEVAEAENARLVRKLEQLARETLHLKAQLPPHQTGDHTSRPHHPRPLPPQDLTESEAREAYKALCGKVQRWVESRLPEMRDAVAAGVAGQVKKPPAQQAARFLSLLREPGKRCLAVSGGEEYHVVAAIMYYLWLGLFSKPFYCPLEEGFEEATMGWILGIETAMGKTRDVEHCREWRSETLTALCSQKSFRSRRDAYVHLLAKDLASYLAVLLPKIPTLDLQISLHKAIVQPAADLAHGLHTSINFFWLKWPLKTASSRLEVYECTNLADGGRTMDLSGTSPECTVRRHTKYLFDIAPGLFVERVEGGKKMALRSICRPKVLIHAGEGSVPHKATLMTWLYNATTF
ncbi:hypothetical protein E4U32_004265 [Claviceps aff. humidiphila group G2b]|nr:hypothetical protein E4U32_004265 [Claviceps aff. humidiphila group G2b]